MRYIFDRNSIKDKDVPIGMKKERFFFRSLILNKGDVVEYGMDSYHRVKRMIGDENIKARIQGKIDTNELLFSIKKINEKKCEVVCNL